MVNCSIVKGRQSCQRSSNDIVASRCFYNSAIDKHMFQGLLVRGNQKKFVKRVSG